MLETTSWSAWSRTVLSVGSVSHGFERAFAFRAASMPTRPREVIPWELRYRDRERSVQGPKDKTPHRYTVIVKILLAL